MTTRKLLFLLINFVYLNHMALSNNLTRESGGGSTMAPAIEQISVNTSICGTKSMTTFQVNVIESGSYLLQFWLMGVKHTNNTFSTYNLRIDNSSTIAGQITTERGDWNNLPSSGLSVYLTQGLHNISLEGTLDDVPNAERVKNTVLEPVQSIHPSPFNNLVLHEYQLRKKHQLFTQIALPYDTLSSTYRMINYFPHENDSTSPPFYYAAELNKSVFYTFYRLEYYTQGQILNYRTDVLDDVHHVIHVFSKDNPTIYSWSSASTGDHATLNITAPQSGFYYVLLRSLSDDEWGTCNLTINNERIFENVPISCSKTEIPAQISTENYTCFAKCVDNDPIILIMQNGQVGNVVNYNDDFPYNSAQSSYRWGKNARIDSPFSQGQWVFTTTKSYPYNVNTDIYAGCRLQSSISGGFPYLCSADVVIASNTTNYNYNCLSWAVGEWMTSFWINELDDNPLDETEYKIGVDALLDAYGFTPIGATESNAVIDLWRGYYSGNNNRYECTHASVRSKGHLYAAGYDWESTLAQGKRIFHPRYSLRDDNGSGYGEVFAHYVKKNNPADIPIDFPIILNINLNQSEIETINREATLLEDNKNNNFEKMYDYCKAKGTDIVTISIDTYERVEGYHELLEVCKDIPSLKFLLFKKICNGDVLSIKLLKDIIASYNKQLLYDVRELVKQLCASQAKSTQKVIYTVQAEALLWIKSLLNDKLFFRLPENYISLSSDDIIETKVFGQKLKISFNLPSDAVVSIILGDINGSMARNIIEQKALLAGKNTFSVQIPPKGVYSIGLIINGSIYKKKILIN